MEIIKNAINDFKSSEIEYLDEIVQNLKEISFQKPKYQDLKFIKINTNENKSRDNPPHELEPIKQNMFITGRMGTGKTTCFDKIYHPFVARQDDRSPIKKYTTDITIQLEDESEKYRFTFKTKTTTRETVITLNSYDEETSLLIMRKIGLIDNPLLPVFFIPQDRNHDILISNDTYFKKFSKFSEILYKPAELKAKKEFKIFLKKLKKIQNETLRVNNHIKNRNIDIEADIDNYTNEINTITKFIDNFEKIKIKLEEIKTNKILRDKILLRNKIFKEITEIQHKLEKLNNIKEFEKNVKKSTNDEIKELYIEYDPICPICNDPISLKSFKQRKKRNQCFLCDDSYYNYPIKDRTPIYSHNEIEISKESLNFEEQLKSLKKQKITLNREINEIKEQTKDQNDELIEIMGNFYIDLNRPGFSIDDEFSRQTNLRENCQGIINEKRKEFERNNEKLEKIKNEIKIIDLTIEKISDYYHKFINELEKENREVFLEFIKNMEIYWKLISKNEKKVIYYNKYEDNLVLATISKNGNPRVDPIISLTSHKQTRISLSQLNVLRYAIHLSLIKSILKKYNALPIRTIIIDDPDDECREEFLEFLKETFLEDLNFQTIIFIDKLELVAEKIKGIHKKFEINEKIQNSDTFTFQTTLDNHLRKKSGLDNSNSEDD
ncbi:MAG: hypothetical protein ACFFAN_05255 [Promethearchaeota archaeon]